MCGIAGILRFNGPPPERMEIERMTHAVDHRGPDGFGIHLQDRIAIGHRRLSIIDLAGGHQPMLTEDQQVCLTYNGEVYNYHELRKELISHGHVFRTDSDTEVILKSYLHWGRDCVLRFRGMFAFAIVDYRRRQILLARDHFGIKPLYYRRGKNFFAFGSELSVIRQVDGEPLRGRLQAIEDFLSFRYIPAPETIFEDVYSLQPAQTMVVDFNGIQETPRTYWRVEFTPSMCRTDEDWLTEFDTVLEDSIRAHMVSDVPFGVFLSGGIDSTLVAWKMQELLGQSVNAFSIGFDEQQLSELKYARQAAEQLGIKLHTDLLDASHAIDILPDLIQHYGQPYADTSMIPTWHVSRLARQNCPMVLSGDGGDEAFSGYPRYQAWTEFHPLWELRNALATARRNPRKFARSATMLFRGPDERAERWTRVVQYLPSELRNRLWSKELRSRITRLNPTFSAAADTYQRADALSFAQSIDYQTYLPDDILVKVDIASMYHGLEVRPPFIDVKVVEFASKLPPHLRSRAYRPKSLKQIPKKLLARRFPPEFVDRQKQGFGIPESKWLAKGTKLRMMLDDLVLNRQSRLNNWFDLNLLNTMALQLDAGQNVGYCLWAFLILGIWLEKNPDVTFAV
jgi:asparagine synthase (glutamine-hydrolysing)